MNVGVWIHDFEEMDRRLLGSAPAARQSRPPLGGYAARSYQNLTRASAVRPASPPREQSAVPDPAAKADRHYQLGLSAEARGAAGVARLHYRTAARHGSALARERLDRQHSTPIANR
jgi:hypothetical protein